MTTFTITPETWNSYGPVFLTSNEDRYPRMVLEYEHSRANPGDGWLTLRYDLDDDDLILHIRTGTTRTLGDWLEDLRPVFKALSVRF